MCIFCKIINNEIPSYKVYEDNNFLAFLDISQTTIGHTLVVPKKHFDNIFDLDEQTASDIMKVVRKLAKKICTNLDVTNVNIFNNNGPLAGQSINHFHIHIIPRYEKDNLVISYPTHKLSNEEFMSLQQKILAD